MITTPTPGTDPEPHQTGVPDPAVPTADPGHYVPGYQPGT